MVSSFKELVEQLDALRLRIESSPEAPEAALLSLQQLLKPAESFFAAERPLTLERELPLLRAESDRLNAKFCAFMQQLDNVKAESDRIQAESDRLQSDLGGIVAKYDEAQAEIDEMKAEIAELKAEREQAKAETAKALAGLPI